MGLMSVSGLVSNLRTLFCNMTVFSIRLCVTLQRNHNVEDKTRIDVFMSPVSSSLVCVHQPTASQIQRVYFTHVSREDLWILVSNKESRKKTPEENTVAKLGNVQLAILIEG